MSIRIIRPDPDRVGIVGDRLFGSSLLHQEIGIIEVGFCIIRLALQRSLALERGFRPADWPFAG